MKVLFDHLHKTGGTGLLEFLRPRFDDSKVSPLLMHEDIRFAANLLGEFDVVGGHMQLKPDYDWASDVYHVTVLRDPVERFLSHYSYVREQPAATEPFAVLSRRYDMAALLRLGDEHVLRTVKDFYTRHFAQAFDAPAPATPAELFAAMEQRYRLIGISECMDDVARILCMVLGLATAPVARVRVTRNRLRQSDIDPDSQALLLELTASDRALYQLAAKRFAVTTRSLGIETSATTEFVHTTDKPRNPDARPRSTLPRGSPRVLAADISYPDSETNNCALSGADCVLAFRIDPGDVPLSPHIELSIINALHQLIYRENRCFDLRDIDNCRPVELLWRFACPLGAGLYRCSLSLGPFRLTDVYEFTVVLPPEVSWSGLVNLRPIAVIEQSDMSAMGLSGTITVSKDTVRGDPGSLLLLPATIRNEGTTAWRAAGITRTAVSYKLFNQEGICVVYNGLRTMLPERTESDDCVEIGLRIRAPVTPGHYTVVPRLVRERVAWFGTGPSVALQVNGSKSLKATGHRVARGRRPARAASATEPTQQQASTSVARSPCLTREMWLIWLLRSDIRQGATPEDLEAQQEFVVWWLLWGRKEYPAVWHWSPELSEVAMRPVAVGVDLQCPRLLRRIHQSRDDLQQAFPLWDSEDVAEFLCWYRVYGPLELETAPPLSQSCLAITESPSCRASWSTSGLCIPRIAITLARRISNLSLQRADAPQIVAAWYEKYDRDLLRPPTAPPSLVTKPPRVRSLTSGGVNLVGFVRGHSGLAEDVRMAAAALEAAGIAHVLLDVPTGPAAPQRDNALTDRLQYDITIYCMSAFDTATLYVSQGPGFFADQYRIGYWPWELPRFPDLLSEVYTLVDEIWTGSTFTKSAYRPNRGIPVHRLPCPVVLPEVKLAPRSRLRLHDRHAFVFVYPFDVNSYLARKNPLSLVRAFRQAFPVGDNGVALLLRVNGDPIGHSGWQEIVSESAADNRITILVGTLRREQALGIVAACDCLVSPHRGEGFGRNIAEAIMLGLPVLATAFSGCMDFLAEDEGISFVPTPLQPGDYPFGKGQWWAEPSIEEMANRMRAIHAASQTDRSAEEQRLLRRRSEVTAEYSPTKTGRDFAHRLGQIERSLTKSGSGRK